MIIMYLDDKIERFLKNVCDARVTLHREHVTQHILIVLIKLHLHECVETRCVTRNIHLLHYTRYATFFFGEKFHNSKYFITRSRFIAHSKDLVSETTNAKPISKFPISRSCRADNQASTIRARTH